MSRRENLIYNVDWILISLYAALVILGWLNIYASVYNDEHQAITDISQKYGKQMIWVVTSVVLAFVILMVDGSFFSTFAYPIYGIALISLVAVLFLGTEVSGSKSWFRIGEFGVQPAEFSKFATNLALAKYLSNIEAKVKVKAWRTRAISFAFFLLPALLILLENETGVALVLVAFIFVLYREGLSGNILLLGFFSILIFILTLLFNKGYLISICGGITLLTLLFIKRNKKNVFILSAVFIIAAGMIYSVDYAYNHLAAHQKQRINVFLGKETDTKKAGYNVNQSLIAIGSGGFAGKGFLNGTQTKYDFVPEQSTDFIFCTVGEEWGFIGTAVVIILFIGLLIRIIFIAERQRSSFSRIYGYGVASILFIHITINIGMTIGLAPVIGIPLPFFSYGGSSLWSFTILLFILIRLDAYRMMVLR